MTRWLFNTLDAKAGRRALVSYVAIILLSCFVIPAGLNSVYNQAIAQPFSTTPSSPSTGLPTIQITSVQEGQQVPPGELTIQGVSSDTEDTDCEVFADVNDVTPMQNVTAAGGDDEDFSTWTFTYSEDYQIISPGQNELTAKISCPPDGGPGFNPPASGLDTGTPTTSASLDEWHTVNVTGVAGAPPATLSSAADGADGADGANGEDGADGADGLGSNGGDGGDGGADGGTGGDGGDGGGGNLFDGLPSFPG
jgi:uncharacterized membrane protein YgcG